MKHDYRYDTTGLDHVMLVGLELSEDEDGDPVVTIRNVNLLHRAIVHALATKPCAMTGKELRFARTELGLTQAGLSALIHVDIQKIGRWERGEYPLDTTAEIIIRVLMLQHVSDVETLPPIAVISGWVGTADSGQVLHIDASDPNHWRPIAA
ncbi:MAG: helix-turn-helix transcriptional regulator [Caulobacteraceae bacterium]|nr:helix-turn-helix transcriptional regulator [Caulobacteraceae bacterium]